MLDNTYDMDIKNIESYLNGKIEIKWDISGAPEGLSRERYLEYYEDHKCDMEPTPYYHRYVPKNHVKFDREKPEHDVLLVYRVNKHYNEKLACIGDCDEDSSTIITDYGGDMYYGDGYLFSTGCCDGWYYDQNRCACGVKRYLNVDDVNFLDMGNVNLNNTRPWGYPCQVGM